MIMTREWRAIRQLQQMARSELTMSGATKKKILSSNPYLLTSEEVIIIIHFLLSRQMTGKYFEREWWVVMSWMA